MFVFIKLGSLFIFNTYNGFSSPACSTKLSSIYYAPQGFVYFINIDNLIHIMHKWSFHPPHPHGLWQLQQYSTKCIVIIFIFNSYNIDAAVNLGQKNINVTLNNIKLLYTFKMKSFVFKSFQNQINSNKKNICSLWIYF